MITKTKGATSTVPSLGEERKNDDTQKVQTAGERTEEHRDMEKILGQNLRRLVARRQFMFLSRCIPSLRSRPFAVPSSLRSSVICPPTNVKPLHSSQAPHPSPGRTAPTASDISPPLTYSGPSNPSTLHPRCLFPILVECLELVIHRVTFSVAGKSRGWAEIYRSTKVHYHKQIFIVAVHTYLHA